MAEEVTHMSWSDTSVLVTGGAGFIGSHLVEELVKAGADRVTVMDNSLTNLRLNLKDVRPVFVERHDVRSCRWHHPEEFDVIFHLAASAYVPPSVKNPLFDYEINCAATLNLLDALRRKQWLGRLVRQLAQ